MLITNTQIKQERTEFGEKLEEKIEEERKKIEAETKNKLKRKKKNREKNLNQKKNNLKRRENFFGCRRNQSISLRAQWRTSRVVMGL